MLRKTDEKISGSPPDPEDWTCLCGNQIQSEGFYPCDSEGELTPEEDLPSYDDWSISWYRCLRCGRIINRETLEVIGQTSTPMKV